MKHNIQRCNTKVFYFIYILSNDIQPNSLEQNRSSPSTDILILNPANRLIFGIFGRSVVLVKTHSHFWIYMKRRQCERNSYHTILYIQWYSCRIACRIAHIAFSWQRYYCEILCVQYFSKPIYRLFSSSSDFVILNSVKSFTQQWNTEYNQCGYFHAKTRMDAYSVRVRLFFQITRHDIFNWRISLYKMLVIKE